MLGVILGAASLPVFANDSKCFRLVLGQDDGNKLQKDSNKLFKCTRIWGMKLNVKKCKALRVARIKCIYERVFSW